MGSGRRHESIVTCVEGDIKQSFIRMAALTPNRRRVCAGHSEGKAPGDAASEVGPPVTVQLGVGGCTTTACLNDPVDHARQA
jgi:hypothetical protein